MYLTLMYLTAHVCTIHGRRRRPQLVMVKHIEMLKTEFYNVCTISNPMVFFFHRFKKKVYSLFSVVLFLSGAVILLKRWVPVV